MTPFFTIITATFNASGILPRLLDSLAAQTCRDFEVLIQDGGSGDATTDIASGYADRLDIRLVSAKDSGVCDAWNKALPRVRGQWILFMGADDALDDADTLQRCGEALREAPDSLRYAGGAVRQYAADGEALAVFPYRPDGADKRLWRAMPFPHQGLFHKRDLFETEQFDASLRIVADFDFVCRTWTAENGCFVLPFVITRMRRGGLSDSPASVLRMRWELAKVAARYHPRAWNLTCFMGLAKGGILWLVCRILGRRAPRFLDFFRTLRGLPPAWKGL